MTNNARREPLPAVNEPDCAFVSREIRMPERAAALPAAGEARP